MSVPTQPLSASPQRWVARLAQVHGAERLTHVETIPARSPELASWPPWVAPPVLAALAGSGVAAPWRHQVQVAQAVRNGEHVVVATGTASGKSLGYAVPVLSAVLDGAGAPAGRGATALYLSPTKALAADQRHRLEALAVPGVRIATLDGDTPTQERTWVRDHAHVVLSNPDLLHHSLLPGHARWAAFLRRLKVVVIDECHIYRGVFGAHVASVVRRLRRVAARYGAHPVFVLASATVAEPAQHAERLTGLPCRAVTQDCSGRGELTFALWRPALQRSAGAEAADLVATLVKAGVQTLAFGRSRAGVEAMAAATRRTLDRDGVDARVAAYRGGYLPRDRRELEAAVRDGSIRALAATNALELGVDISGLDAVVMAGWPGRASSLWQQAGRAGRSRGAALAVFVADDDPLDRYVVGHPSAIFGAPAEASVLDPDNPHVLAPHLAAAAAELPLTPADLPLFGSAAAEVVQVLQDRAILRRRPHGWFWARPERPGDHVSLRGTASVVTIAEGGSGRVLGTVDEASAHSQVHTGAVHVHQGQVYVVIDLDLEHRVATVVAGDPGWTTTAQSHSTFRILSEQDSTVAGPVRWSFGTVQVTGQVRSFLRRLPSGEVLGQHPLELPERELVTRAVWHTVDPDVLAGAGIDADTVPGAAHAAEHAAIGVLPLLATCDRWDIGGVSTAAHEDTGLPTVMVYDGYPGGAGFARRAFERGHDWGRVTRDTVANCPCRSGCPGCVQSPKCGNGNKPLDKDGALRWLDLLVSWGSHPGR